MNNKTIVITGSASGIGAATAAYYRKAGHKVIGVDIKNADVVADLSTKHGRKNAIEAINEIAEEHIDGLICCAGLGVTAPSSRLIIEVNYFGAVDIIKSLIPSLKQAEKPVITIVGSFAAVQQLAAPEILSKALLANDHAVIEQTLSDISGPHVAYSASKYALTVYCRTQAVTLGKLGIRINVVAPGAVTTPLHQASLDDPRFGSAVKNFVAPMGAHTEPEQIAKTIAFLQSSAASFIHGSVLFVDGGMDAMLRPNQF